jgi:hypothetical protein
MGRWNSSDLDRIAETDEVRLATAADDGTLRTPVVMWVVRHGDDLYIRSYKGAAAKWFRGTQLSPHGRLFIGQREIDVTLELVGEVFAAEIDAAYADKYGRYGQGFVDAMVSPEVQATTLRILPAV